MAIAYWTQLSYVFGTSAKKHYSVVIQAPYAHRYAASGTCTVQYNTDDMVSPQFLLKVHAKRGVALKPW